MFGWSSNSARILWNKRCAPPWAQQRSLVGYFIHIKCSTHRIVKGVKLCLPNFEAFSLQDLERLKNSNKWLSDSHVTLVLLFVPFSVVVSLSKWNSDWFRNCFSKNVWGNLKIHLLDTTFWTQLSVEPERYGERFRTKLGLLEYDYVVMPMFSEWVHQLIVAKDIDCQFCFQ